MAMELLEKGRVRFWTQVEKCTSNCTVEYVFNDVIITEGKVGMILKKIKHVLCCPVCPPLSWIVFQKQIGFLYIFCF